MFQCPVLTWRCPLLAKCQPFQQMKLLWRSKMSWLNCFRGLIKIKFSVGKITWFQERAQLKVIMKRRAKMKVRFSTKLYYIYSTFLFFVKEMKEIIYLKRKIIRVQEVIRKHSPYLEACRCSNRIFLNCFNILSEINNICENFYSDFL